MPDTMSDRLDLAVNTRCRVCKAIARMIKTPLRRQFSQSISFTEDEDPVSWNCACHEPLLHLSNPHDNGIISRGNLSLSKWKGQPVFRVKNTVLHLARRDNVPCHWGMGRILGREWIDLDVIKGFIDNCAQNHGAICAKFPFGDAPNAIDAPRPAFLIDVDASCVVDANDAVTGEPFTMLSYVRGDQRDHLSLTTHNLKELQQPGGLKALGTLELIPRTFRDAMSLAALLGIRYIWIDRLCVLQDDDAHRRSEMTKVTLLSVCAVFVIAECDGTNASHGIRGIREIPDAQPRSFAQKWAAFGDGEAIVRSAAVTRGHQLEAGRAWRDGVTYTCQGDTFAETVLARRVLRFEMGTVQWRCRSWPTYCGDEEQDDHMWEDCAHRCDRARWHCQMDWPTVIEKEEEWDSEESDDDGLWDGGPPHWTRALAKPWPGVREYYSMLMDLTAQKSVKPSDMPTILGGLAVTLRGASRAVSSAVCPRRSSTPPCFGESQRDRYRRRCIRAGPGWAGARLRTANIPGACGTHRRCTASTTPRSRTRLAWRLFPSLSGRSGTRLTVRRTAVFLYRARSGISPGRPFAMRARRFRRVGSVSGFTSIHCQGRPCRGASRPKWCAGWSVRSRASPFGIPFRW